MLSDGLYERFPKPDTDHNRGREFRGHAMLHRVRDDPFFATFHTHPGNESKDQHPSIQDLQFNDFYGSIGILMTRDHPELLYGR